MLAPATVAAAAPADRERWQITAEAELEHCGLTLYEHRDIRGVFVANTRGRDQVWFGAARVQGTVTLTNEVTGRSAQLRFAVNDKDLAVRPNEDGTAISPSSTRACGGGHPTTVPRSWTPACYFRGPLGL
jgi:hypothetical protein